MAPYQVYIIMQKQFRRPKVTQLSGQKKEDDSQEVPFSFAEGIQDKVLDSAVSASQVQNKHDPSAEENRVSVHERLRIPVSYDDDLLKDTVNNDAN